MTASYGIYFRWRLFYAKNKGIDNAKNVWYNIIEGILVNYNN